MARAPWTPSSLYEVAAAWVENCLGRNGSLFTPGREIWTGAAIDEAAARFLTDDVRKLDFMTKLHDQLEGISDTAMQFSAELLYMHTLTISNAGVDAKRGLVEPVLNWMQSPVTLSAELVEPLSGGVANYGAGLAQRDRYVKYFVRFVQAWKKLDGSEVASLLADPWAFRDFVHGLGGPALMQREAILHLVFPETFENAIAPDDKKRIVKAFATMPGLDTRNDDRALASIRAAVEEQTGETLELYLSWFSRVWRHPSPPGWPEVLRLSKRLLESPEFDEEERDYKLEIADRMRAVKSAIDQGTEWVGLLSEAFRVRSHPVYWRVADPFVKWCEQSPEAAARFLKALWALDSPEVAAIGGAVALLPDEVIPSATGRTTLVAGLLMEVDPTTFVPYRARPVNRLLRHLGVQTAVAAQSDGDDEEAVPYGQPAEGGDDVAHRYREYLDLLDELRVRLLAAGVQTRDRLDAQGVVWWLSLPDPPESWSNTDKAAWTAFQTQKPSQPRPSPEPAPEPAASPALPRTSQELAEDLHLPISWLDELVDLLDEKKQLVFFGPPGTGKTLVATKFSEYLIANGGGAEIVQFHPSYSYEDFFEGYRPDNSTGSLTYTLTPGPLRRIADAASRDPGRPYLLIVDEINRGNVAKIFGELLYLLEYRDHSITLQYSPDERFSLPPNLYLIGTMNTADRSIALVDSALRRRFYFVPFLPSEMPIVDVLRQWLERHGLDDEPDRLLRELNKRMADSELAVGPSYFMTKDGSAPNVERVWRHAITPLLEEYYYGTDRNVSDEFGLDAIRRSLSLSATEGEEPSTPAF